MQGSDQALATNLFSVIVSNGGGTLSPKGGTPKVVQFDDGYMVSLKGHERKISEQNFTIDAFIKVYNALLQERGERKDIYIGFWCDGNGVWYGDLSQHVADKQDAAYLGRGNDQQAIWDCRASAEYWLDNRNWSVA